MKKYFSFLITFYILFFPVLVQAETLKKVYMVLWDGCEDACRGFQDYLKAERVDAEIVLRDAKKRPSKIPEFIDEAKKMKPDLLVTWGSYVTLEMLGTERNELLSKYIRSIPALFMVVSQPVESGLVSALVSQGRNITGVTHLVPLIEQLQYARQVIPYKRMGIIYNLAETNAAVTVEQIKKYASLMGFEVLDRPVPTDKEMQPDPTTIEGLVADLAEKNTDLIYLGPDAFMNMYRDALTDAATAAGIPVFSASEGAVRNGEALFAFVHRYYNIGQMAGQKAVKILNEQMPAYDIPIEAPQRALLVVNMTAARNLNVYPPLPLIQGADLINIPDELD